MGEKYSEIFVTQFSINSIPNWPFLSVRFILQLKKKKKKSNVIQKNFVVMFWRNFLRLFSFYAISTYVRFCRQSQCRIFLLCFYFKILNEKALSICLPCSIWLVWKRFIFRGQKSILNWFGPQKFKFTTWCVNIGI